MNNKLKNYYDVLEITTDANQEEIQSAYNRARNAYSGESVALYSLMSEDECSEVVQKIEEAYAILGQPEKRREYDRVRGLNQNPQINKSQSATNKPITIFEDTSLPKFEEKERQEKEEFTWRPTGSLVSSTLEMAAAKPQARAEVGTDDFNINRKDVYVSKITAQNRFSLQYNSDQKIESEIENATSYTGDLLRRIREYKNVDLERMSELTKISKSYLQNIERDEWDKLPAQVYTRGFVFQVAKILKLNPEIVATSYIHHLKTIRNGK